MIDVSIQNRLEKKVVFVPKIYTRCNRNKKWGWTCLVDHPINYIRLLLYYYKFTLGIPLVVYKHYPSIIIIIMTCQTYFLDCCAPHVLTAQEPKNKTSEIAIAKSHDGCTMDICGGGIDCFMVNIVYMVTRWSLSLFRQTIFHSEYKRATLYYYRLFELKLSYMIANSVGGCGWVGGWMGVGAIDIDEWLWPINYTADA